jgi:hypothetical protein
MSARCLSPKVILLRTLRRLAAAAAATPLLLAAAPVIAALLWLKGGSRGWGERSSWANQAGLMTIDADRIARFGRKNGTYVPIFSHHSIIAVQMFDE